MEINELNLVNSQSFNFKSAKTRATRIFNSRAFENYNTLKDRFESKNKNSFVRKKHSKSNISYYQNYRKECEEASKKVAINKQTENLFTVLRSVLKQVEYDKKTCNTFLYELAKYQKDVYNKLISRCFGDVEAAILRDAPKTEVDKLTGTLDMFINKFSHYDRPL